MKDEKEFKYLVKTLIFFKDVLNRTENTCILNTELLYYTFFLKSQASKNNSAESFRLLGGLTVFTRE